VLLRDTHTHTHRKRHNESDCSWCIIISLPASLAARRVNSRATCSAALHNNNHRSSSNNDTTWYTVYSLTHNWPRGRGLHAARPLIRTKGAPGAESINSRSSESFSHFCIQAPLCVLAYWVTLAWLGAFLCRPGGICYCRWRPVKFRLCARISAVNGFSNYRLVKWLFGCMWNGALPTRP